MFNIGPLELTIIFLIALVVVGPRKLPDLGRTIGNGLREFRKAQEEVRKSLRTEEFDDVRREISEAKSSMREALNFQPPSPSPPPTIGNGAGPDGAPDATSTSPRAAEPATDASPAPEPGPESE